jgi:hypothetical protein
MSMSIMFYHNLHCIVSNIIGCLYSPTNTCVELLVLVSILIGILTTLMLVVDGIQLSTTTYIFVVAECVSCALLSYWCKVYGHQLDQYTTHFDVLIVFMACQVCILFGYMAYDELSCKIPTAEVVSRSVRTPYNLRPRRPQRL